MKELLQPLLLLVLVGCGLSLRVLLRRRMRWDWPTIGILSGLSIAAAYCLLQGNAATDTALVVILVAFLQAEIPGRLDRFALKARLQGNLAAAWRWSWMALFLQPTAGRRTKHRLLVLMQEVKEKRKQHEDAIRELEGMEEDVETLRNISVSFLWHEAIFAFRAVRGLWTDIAERFSPEHFPWYAAPPSGMGKLMLEALLRVGELETAAELLEKMEDSDTRGDNAPEESDIRHNQSRLLFVAYLGQQALVEKAFARGSTLREIFDKESQSELLQLSRLQQSRIQQQEFFIPDSCRSLLPLVSERLQTESSLSMGSGALQDAQPATLSLVIVLFLASALVAITGSTVDPLHLLRSGGAQLHLVLQGDWWRLMTATFLHGGWLHLLFNAYFLLWFGNIVERWVGPWRFLGLYLFSGLVGFVSALGVGTDKLIVGASGNAFGIFGATFLLLLWKRKELPRRWYKRQFLIAVVLIVLNLYLGLSIPQISLSAHVGGFVGGFVLAALLLWLMPMTSTKLRFVGRGLVLASWGVLSIVSLYFLIGSLRTPMTQWPQQLVKKSPLPVPVFRLVALHKDPSVRYKLLQSLQPVTKDATQVLFQLWYDDTDKVKEEVRRQLVTCGKACLPAASRLLQDEDPRTRGAAALFLTRNIHRYKPAFPLLLKQANDENLVVRSIMLDAISSHAPLSSAVENQLLPLLKANLRSRNYFVRMSSLKLLQKYQQFPVALVPDIKLVFRQARWGREALTAAQTLLSAGRTTHSWVRAWLLTPKAPHQKELLQALQKHDTLPSEFVDTALVMASSAYQLGLSGELIAALAAHPQQTLQPLLQHPNQSRWSPTQWKLAEQVFSTRASQTRFAGFQRKLLPGLRKALRYPRKEWRRVLLLWLQHWKGLQAPLLPELLHNLSDKSEGLQIAALLALKEGKFQRLTVQNRVWKVTQIANQRVKMTAWKVLVSIPALSETFFLNMWKAVLSMKDVHVQRMAVEALSRRRYSSALAFWSLYLRAADKEKRRMEQFLPRLGRDFCLLKGQIAPHFRTASARYFFLRGLHSCKLTMKERKTWADKALDDNHPLVRFEALRNLLRVPSTREQKTVERSPRKVVTAFQALLSNKKTSRVSLRWLQKWSFVPGFLHTTLRHLLLNSDGEQRVMVLKLLQKSPLSKNKWLPVVKPLLEAGNVFVQSEAILLWARLQQQKAIPKLLQWLTSPDTGKRHAATAALRALLKNSKHQKVLEPQLAMLLKKAPRESLQLVLSLLGHCSRSIQPMTIHNIVKLAGQHPQKMIRDEAFQTLSNLGAVVAKKVTTLLRLILRSKKDTRHQKAADVLLGLGKAGRPLFKELQQCGSPCSSGMFAVMSQMPSQASQVVSWLPELESMLYRASPLVLDVWKVLLKLEKQGQPIVFRALSSLSPMTRTQALRVLANQAKRNTPRLKTWKKRVWSLTTDQHNSVRQQALATWTVMATRRQSLTMLKKLWQVRSLFENKRKEEALRWLICLNTNAQWRKKTVSVTSTCLQVMKQWNPEKHPLLWSQALEEMQTFKTRTSNRPMFFQWQKSIQQKLLSFWQLQRHTGKQYQLWNRLLGLAWDKPTLVEKAARKIVGLGLQPLSEKANLAEAMLHLNTPASRKESRTLANAVMQKTFHPSLRISMLHLLWMESVVPKGKGRKKMCLQWWKERQQWKHLPLLWNFDSTRLWLQKLPKKQRALMQASLPLLERPQTADAQLPPFCSGFRRLSPTLRR